jgi:tetratricopeptide (TPR) repeat protein
MRQSMLPRTTIRHEGARRVAVALAAAVAAWSWLAAPATPALAAPPAASRGESRAARDQARLCERLSGEEAVEACRGALSLGIGPARRGPVRALLARQLAALERWDELADLFREGVRLDPGNAEAWQRLGSTLLFALGAPAEAVSALQEAVRLAPADAPTRLALGQALAAAGRPDEARAAIEEALRLDPSVLDGHPAARAALDAARQGRSWP